MKAILGRKIGMTELFDGKTGEAVAVTVIEAGPCLVVRTKSVETDGYDACVVGYGAERKKPLKPHIGEFKKRNLESRRMLREFRGTPPEGVKPGDDIGVSIFKVGDSVDVIGKTKGRGTTGVMKRWNFHGAPGSHGTEKRHRTPGSIGSNTDPGRTIPGKKLAGRYGDERVTIQNLRIVQVDPENRLLAVSGAIPGPRSGLVLVQRAVKARISRSAAPSAGVSDAGRVRAGEAKS
ncbi:50S ribosomal protein L3 [bacterium]|nr:50S ribosomal protein L3 [bacterium]